MLQGRVMIDQILFLQYVLNHFRNQIKVSATLKGELNEKRGNSEQKNIILFKYEDNNNLLFSVSEERHS